MRKKTVKQYLKDQPHTVIGMAIFDMGCLSSNKKNFRVYKAKIV